jgi:N-acetylglucosaminyldiphosphoundecaprenol N-acetyl-beta-D-mannosaminyltransferase
VSIRLNHIEMNRCVQICGVNFPVINYNSALNCFREWIEERKPHQIYAVNVHSLIESVKNPNFLRIINSADLLTMDGEPLRWYANFVMGESIQERVCGPELMLRCVEYGIDRGWKHFFMGSTTSVLAKLKSRFEMEYPGVKIVGISSPPFRPLTRDENNTFIQIINSSGTDFLWVGLGAPKQEKWINDNFTDILAPIQAGVGAAFDFHSGNIPRAPKALQRLGLEWLFRTYNDPRLWKRYLTTNPKFMFIFLKDMVKLRVFRK